MRITDGCHASGGQVDAFPAQLAVRPSRSASACIGFSQSLGSCLPVLRQIACASATHCASARPCCRRAFNSPQRNAVFLSSLLEGCGFHAAR
jgi:hypothetical protein